MASTISEKIERWGALALLLLMTVNIYNVFLFAPTEKTMGNVQRIFYFHVPSAFVAFVAFSIVAIYSIAFLVTRKFWYDRIAYAAAEIGILFTTIVLITGPIWAKPAWGTWWTWDPRLTTTLILWFVYVAYLMLRNFTGEDEKGARFAAVFAIIGFVDVPIVFFSIRWWRTIHPSPVIRRGGLESDMLFTLLFSIGVFMLLLAYLLFARLRLERSRQAVLQMKKEIALNE